MYARLKLFYFIIQLYFECLHNIYYYYSWDNEVETLKNLLDKSGFNFCCCYSAYHAALGVHNGILLCITTLIKSIIIVVADLNNGIVMTILSSKPIISSFAFYFLFRQKLEKFEIISIFILFVSVILIGFSSKESKEVKKSQGTLYIIVSMLMLVGSTVLVSLRTVIIKYFLAYGQNQADI